MALKHFIGNYGGYYQEAPTTDTLLISAVQGNTLAGSGLTLVSNNTATKGLINFGIAGTSFFDEANNYLKIVTPNISAATPSTTSGIYLSNPTAGTLGTINQVSPQTLYDSNVWNTTNSVNVNNKARTYCFGSVGGAATSCIWSVDHNLNNLGWSSSLYVVSGAILQFSVWRLTSSLANSPYGVRIAYSSPRILFFDESTGFGLGVGVAGNTSMFSHNLGVGIGSVTGTVSAKLHVVNTTTLNTTTAIASGIYLQNTFASTSGVAVQNSPLFTQEGSAWNTTTPANNVVSFSQWIVPVSGASVTGSWNLGSQVNGGTLTSWINVTTAGVLQLGTGVNGTINNSNLIIGTASFSGSGSVNATTLFRGNSQIVVGNVAGNSIQIITGTTGFFSSGPTGSTTALYQNGVGQIGIGAGTSFTTALLNIGAGTATVAPLKLTAGTNTTVLGIGQIEFVDNGTTGHLYITLNVAGVLTRVQIV